MTDRDHFAAAATDDQSDWLRHAVARDAITIAKLEAEIARLREAIRRLADQDATLSVCNGGVTVTMDGTLTGAEREAVEEAMRQVVESDCIATPHALEVIGTLRGLLERMK
jgi:hypothetical protein